MKRPFPVQEKNKTAVAPILGQTSPLFKLLKIFVDKWYVTDGFIKNSLGAGPKDDDVITDSSGDLRVVSRREWLAEPPLGELLKLDLPVSRVIIAHTASLSCEKLVFESPIFPPPNLMTIFIRF